MNATPVRLAESDWRARERAHVARADALTAEHRERAARGEKHPVWDFLFTYYSYAPAQLRRWHPGPGVQLADAGREFLCDAHTVRIGALFNLVTDTPHDDAGMVAVA